MGLAHIFLGHAEETEAHVLEALRLSPGDTAIWAWFLHVGGAKAPLGKDEEALHWLNKSIDANRNVSLAFFLLSAGRPSPRERWAYLTPIHIVAPPLICAPASPSPFPQTMRVA
jgi:hypothetical protein